MSGRQVNSITAETLLRKVVRLFDQVRCVGEIYLIMGSLGTPDSRLVRVRVRVTQAQAVRFEMQESANGTPNARPCSAAKTTRSHVERNNLLAVHNSVGCVEQY